MKFSRLFLFLVVAVVFYKCVSSAFDDSQSSESDETGLSNYVTRPESFSVAESKQKWITKPFDQWPIIVLTNAAKLKNGEGVYGASSYLVKYKGEILACTAQHLLSDDVGPINLNNEAV